MSTRIGKIIPKSLKKILINISYLPEKIFFKVYRLGATGKIYVPDKIFQKWDVKIHSGRVPNINHPVTYQDKLQWLKLYNRKPEFTNMVDKYAVRSYISEKIGEEILVKCYGVFDKWDDIEFDSLPNEFVVKCTHDSGSVSICYDKEIWNMAEAKDKIEKGLSVNHFYRSREWPYKNVKPRIIVEELLKDDNQPVLNDYKIYCFNGKAKMILICTERNSEKGACYDYYDMSWNRLDVSKERHSAYTAEKPYNYSDMIRIAEMLSCDIPFLRVDFYEVNRKLYFGELTFFSGGGRHPWKDEKTDTMLGEWITLPERKVKNR